MRFWAGTIFGEPASKANQRKLVTFGGRWITYAGEKIRVGGRPAFIKSDKARAYLERAFKDVPVLDPMLQGPLRFTAKIFYASNLPDLDESLILDALQGRIYKNDRQVRERHVMHGIDRDNPRAIVRVEEMSDLPLPANIQAEFETMVDDENEGVFA